MRLITTVIFNLALVVLASVAQTSQPANFKDPVTQCEETIRQRLAPSQTQYAAELDAMMKSFQAKGELEKLLVTKQEKERSMNVGQIEDGNIVQTPVELRNLQLRYKVWQGKLVQQTANEFVTMLEGQKKKLTVEGKIDEAMSVKKDIEKIQQQYGVVTQNKLNTIIALSEPIDDAFSKLDLSAKMKMGQRIKDADEKMFGGDLIIRAFERGLIIASKNGRTQTIFFQSKGIRQSPFGDIGEVYRQKGEYKTFGRPLEGEHSLFDEVYRLHVFETAIIVWRRSDRSVQTAIFDKKFKSS